MRAALLAVVRFYQRAISPAFPPRCRFYPSCSAYALEAIELAKCAPWHPGGVDLVPGSGTAGAGHTSCTAAPEHATPPAHRAPQEESSVA